MVAVDYLATPKPPRRCPIANDDLASAAAKDAKVSDAADLEAHASFGLGKRRTRLRRASSQPSMRTYHIFFVGTPFMASAVLCERPRLARMARSSLRGFAARVRPQQRPKWELAGAREDANE